MFSDFKAALEDPEKLGLGEGVKLYGLPILWNIVQDSFHADGEKKSGSLSRVALEAMEEILARPVAPQLSTTGQGQRIYYLLKAINNLRKGVSLYPSACLVMGIIEVIDSQSGG